MGCAACFRGRAIAEPYRKGCARSRSILEHELKQLQPSRLIREEEFQRLWRRLADHCEAFNRPQQPSGEDQIAVRRSTTAAPANVLTSKWKLLIFCRGFDFYEKQEDQCNPTLTHSCFPQIGKDLHRTFPEEALFQSEEGIRRLQQCLHRVALYFPSVGYTQGVNFIVGYLMLRDYSENETFWMVAHLVLCQRYLLLGLFQDGFPLAGIYCRLFRLLLRQQRPRLHAWLMQLGIADEIWVFKWFMTYFLYSFPLQIVEQAWDVVMMLGGIGLVYFAYSIVEQLEQQLLSSEDDSDVSGLISSLKDLTTFRTFINVEVAANRSYEVKLSDQQIAQEIQLMRETLPQSNFYVDYFASSNNKEKQGQLLEQWHAKLKRERVEFRNNQLVSLHSSKQLKPRRRQTKFRVKDQQKKDDQLKIQELRRSSSVFSQISSNGNPQNNSHRSPSKDREEIGNLSRVLSQANSQHLPSEESMMEIITPQESNRSDRKTTNENVQNERMNASVHIIKAQANREQQQQHEIEIFDLKGKPISFKKKKMSENGLLKAPRGRLFKKVSEKELKLPRNNPSISKHDAREILHSIENEDRSVVEFEGSSNFIESTSDKKPPQGSPGSFANDESIKVISLEDGAQSHSIEVESVR